MIVPKKISILLINSVDLKKSQFLSGYINVTRRLLGTNRSMTLSNRYRNSPDKANILLQHTTGPF